MSHAWLPVCVLKHSLIETIEGGMSRIMRDILRLWKLPFAIERKLDYVLNMATLLGV